MKIAKCCEEIQNPENSISISTGIPGLPWNEKPIYIAGDDFSSKVTEIEIKYCPFCGKKIEVVR